MYVHSLSHSAVEISVRVRVTSSDDSRVDRIACAGSPSLSHLFLGWCDGVMDSARDLLGESVP